MKLLPSELRARIEEIRKEIRNLKEGERLCYEEPCNCGNNIRHNSGGNYHDIVTIALDGGDYWRLDDSTGGLNEAAEWTRTTLERILDFVPDMAAAGM